MENYPLKAVVIAKEKRQDPVKHYVFIVEIKWSDGCKIPVYRQYSDFAQLHTDLSEFVNTSPEFKKNYQLPHFPSKKVFQRNEISKNASVRRHAFDDYCQSLLKMNKIISQHKHVIAFFKARDTDINPLTISQTKTGKNRTSLLQALAVLVPGSKKQSNGSGGNIRQSRSSGDLSAEMDEDDPIYVSSPIVCESYRALADYTPQEKGEIKLKEDQMVEVVEKYANGWWFIQTEYGFGWAPATYLTVVTPKPQEDEDEPEPVYSGHQYITTKAYQAELDDELTFDKGVLVKVLHKLMDGWWIISYQGEVGYAPATQLVSFQNPHFRDSRYGQKQNRKPTNRRRTIKNGSGKFLKDSKERDLSVYKKMNARLEEIRKKRSEVKFQQNRVEKEDTKAQEYEYVDENEMEQVQEWAETQRRSSVSSTQSIIGPPLPPRPRSTASPVDVVFNMTGLPQNTSPRRQSDGTGLVYVKQPQSLPQQSEGFDPETHPQHSKTLTSGATFNKAPPSPRANRKRIQSAYTATEGSEDGNRTKFNARNLAPRLSVPEICITGCDSEKPVEDNSTSSEEETVESLYATEKDVKPKESRQYKRNEQMDHALNGQSGTRSGDGAEISDDSSNEEEETVESLYGNTKNVKALIRTKVRGQQGTVEYTEVNKSKQMDRKESVDEYMPMDRYGTCTGEDGEIIEDTEEQVHRELERKDDHDQHKKEAERTQGSGAEGGAKKSSGKQGEMLTGQNAMDVLIESLRSKSIGGVYTNEKGELCIQFENS